MQSPLEQGNGHEVAAAPKCVLVVEHDPGVRRVLVRMLEKEGYRALAAVVGPSTLELVEPEPPPPPVDLILIDLAQPGLDGTALLRTIRQRDSLRPIIALQGRGTPLLDTLEAGATLALHKPFAPAQVLELIADLTARDLAAVQSESPAPAPLPAPTPTWTRSVACPRCGAADTITPLPAIHEAAQQQPDKAMVPGAARARPPRGPWPGQVEAVALIGGLVLWLVTLFGGIQSGLLRRASNPETFMFVGLAVTLAVFWLLGRYLESPNPHPLIATAAYRQARRRWEQSYYCSADDLVFHPGERSPEAVAQRPHLLHQQSTGSPRA